MRDLEGAVEAIIPPSYRESGDKQRGAATHTAPPHLDQEDTLDRRTHMWTALIEAQDGSSEP
jgi:hypothetical protein